MNSKTGRVYTQEELEKTKIASFYTLRINFDNLFSFNYKNRFQFSKNEKNSPKTLIYNP